MLDIQLQLHGYFSYIVTTETVAVVVIIITIADYHKHILYGPPVLHALIIAASSLTLAVTVTPISIISLPEP